MPQVNIVKKMLVVLPYHRIQKPVPRESLIQKVEAWACRCKASLDVSQLHAFIAPLLNAAKK